MNNNAREELVEFIKNKCKVNKLTIFEFCESVGANSNFLRSLLLQKTRITKSMFNKIAYQLDLTYDEYLQFFMYYIRDISPCPDDAFYANTVEDILNNLQSIINTKIKGDSI